MPMKSGCCNNFGGGPDFSLVTLPPSVLTTDLMASLGLWVVGLAVVIEPFIRPLIMLLCRQTGWTKNHHQQLIRIGTKSLISHCTLIYTIITCLSFYKILQTQPYSPSLQNNQTLAIGYLLVLTGLVLKASFMVHRRCTSQDTDKDTSKSATKDAVVYKEEVVGQTVWWLLVMTGCSLVMARIAGVVICFLLLLSNTSRGLFERYVKKGSSIGSKLDVWWISHKETKSHTNHNDVSDNKKDS